MRALKKKHAHAHRARATYSPRLELGVNPYTYVSMRGALVPTYEHFNPSPSQYVTQARHKKKSTPTHMALMRHTPRDSNSVSNPYAYVVLTQERSNPLLTAPKRNANKHGTEKRTGRTTPCLHEHMHHMHICTPIHVFFSLRPPSLRTYSYRVQPPPPSSTSLQEAVYHRHRQENA